MQEPETMDLEFCYYSGSDEADEDYDEPAIVEDVNSDQIESQTVTKEQIKPTNENNCVKINEPKLNQYEEISSDDCVIISSDDDTDDESPTMKRITVGRRKKAISSIRNLYRKNIRRLSRHKREGKPKNRKEKENEIKSNSDVVNLKKNSINGLNVTPQNGNGVIDSNHIFKEQALAKIEALVCDEQKEMKEVVKSGVESENENQNLNGNIEQQKRSEVDALKSDATHEKQIEENKIIKQQNGIEIKDLVLSVKQQINKEVDLDCEEDFIASEPDFLDSDAIFLKSDYKKVEKNEIDSNGIEQKEESQINDDETQEKKVAAVGLVDDAKQEVLPLENGIENDANKEEQNEIDNNDIDKQEESQKIDDETQEKTKVDVNLNDNAQQKEENGVENSKDAEREEKHENNDLNCSRTLRKRSGSRVEVIDRDAKQKKPNEIEDDAPSMITTRLKTRQSILKTRSKSKLTAAKSLTVEPIGDSTTTYSDSNGHIYFKKMTQPKSIYLMCKRKSCPGSINYNIESGMARMINDHSNHSVRKNDIRLIELNQLIQTKANDPKLNHIERGDLYFECLAEFERIRLPEGFYKKSVDRIRYIRRLAQENPAKNDKKQSKVSKVKSKTGMNPENLSLEPLADSDKLFKDANYNIYRKLTTNSHGVYLKCQGENCKATAFIYNTNKKNVRFIGKHSKHPSKQNDIRLIEFNFLMRSRAIDPKYSHVKGPDLYNQCIAEFKGIEMPESSTDHRQQSIMAINYCRKRVREIRKKNPNASLDLNDGLKLYAIIPKTSKKGQSTPPEDPKTSHKKSPKNVVNEEPKKACCTCTCGCHNAASPVETPAKIVKNTPKSSGAKNVTKSPSKTPTSSRSSKKEKCQQPTILSFFTKPNKMNREARASI